MPTARTWMAAGGGTAAMYLLDPNLGRSRRVRMMEQFAARFRTMRRRTERERRHSEGVAEGLRHHGPARIPADDQVLADRVKSALGPVLPLDRINLDVVAGVVEVREELDDVSDR